MLPHIDEGGGGPAGVNELAVDGGGAKGVVDKWVLTVSVKTSLCRPRRWLGGVAGGEEEKGTVKPAGIVNSCSLGDESAGIQEYLHRSSVTGSRRHTDYLHVSR